MSEPTCLTCRFFFALTSGPSCLNLRAPLLYGPGKATDPAKTVCAEWRAVESRAVSEAMKPLHNQQDYDQWMGK